MRARSAGKGVVLAFPGFARDEQSRNPSEPAPVSSARHEIEPLRSDPPGTSTLVDSGSEPAAEYDEVFSRLSKRVQAGDRIAANERENAPLRFAELLSQPAAERADLVREDRRFHSFLLAEMLLERCREARPDQLSQSLESATLAVEISKRLDENFYGVELRLGLEMKAWAVLGNCLRLQGNLPEAESVFAEVDRLAGVVAEDSAERTDALSFKVSLLNDQSRFDEAQLILHELIRVYRRNQDDLKLGKALIQYGLVQGETGDIDGAIESQLESLRLLRECGDEKLSALALGNLASFLEDAGRSEEALQFLGEARAWLERAGSESHLIRARWLEGRIAASLEQDDKAEAAFDFVRKFFSDRAVDTESAMACLDLALLYCKQDRMQELKELAAEMVPLFERQGLDQQVMAALVLFRHAAEKEIATLGLLQEIATYVKRTQHQQGS